MFGPYQMNKALCLCGNIADLDTKVISTKHGLGKRVECRACRNKRIAMEKEMLERWFDGREDEEENGL